MRVSERRNTFSTEVKNQQHALKVNDGWTPGCFRPEAMKHPNQCRYGGHLCLSEPWECLSVTHFLPPPNRHLLCKLTGGLLRLLKSGPAAAAAAAGV